MNSNRELIMRAPTLQTGPVVYVMSRDQRTKDNHALVLAQQKAIENKVPLYVLFVVKSITTRSLEHYEFMLGGLEEVAAELANHNIPFIMRMDNTTDEITGFLKETKSSMVYFDFSPLRHAKRLLNEVATRFDGGVTVVDTHNIVPTWVASDKQEFAAHTMRRKIHSHLEAWLQLPEQLVIHPYSGEPVATYSVQQARAYIKQTVGSSGIMVQVQPGGRAAKVRLRQFIKNELANYALKRNDIAHDSQSGLSPYLHFGQISSLRVAIEIMNSTNSVPLLLREPRMAQAGTEPSKEDGMNALFEEMIVRKELSDNFCFYSEDYTSVESAASWAQDTLRKHATDPREFLYSTKELEAGQTHDDAWNAAQLELTKSGKIHGYMRMYWAKKILEWSETPPQALKTAIYLNDKYSIDGGDPNGYVGILWSIAGLHDRAWTERPIFGKIRYMNEAGLRRKFSVDDYIKRVGAK